MSVDFAVTAPPVLHKRSLRRVGETNRLEPASNPIRIMNYKRIIKYSLIFFACIVINVFLHFLLLLPQTKLTETDRFFRWRESANKYKITSSKRTTEYCGRNTSFMTNSKSTLESIFVITRHGDRSPLSSIMDDFKYRLNCSMDFTSSSNLEIKYFFQRILGTVKSFRVSTSLDELYGGACASGQLTPTGLKQQIDLGMSLNNYYFHTLGFAIGDKITRKRVQVYATKTQRTVFSAMSLLRGYFRGTTLRSPISLLNGYTLCDRTEITCKCKAVSKYQRQVSHIVRNAMKAEENQDLLEYFGQFFGRELFVNTYIEMLMPKVCHSEHNVACWGNKCLEADRVEKLWNLDISIGLELSKSSAGTKLARILMFPWFLQLLRSIKSITSGVSHTRFTLYSGHDHTIRYILAALGLYDGQWPRYAANIVFGLTKIGPRKYGFYILYNGKDVTEKLHFCNKAKDPEEVGIDCDLQHFKNFIERTYFDIFDFNFSSLSSREHYVELCS